VKDFRTQERDSILYRLSVLNAQDMTSMGVLGDLSREGILILSEKPLQEKTRLWVRITLPPEDFSIPFFELTLEVRWSKPDLPRQNQFASGCLILEGKEKYAPIIEKLMEHYGFLRL